MLVPALQYGYLLTTQRGSWLWSGHRPWFSFRFRDDTDNVRP